MTAGDYRYIDGHFLSPFTKHLPGVMPKEVEIARYKFLINFPRIRIDAYYYTCADLEIKCSKGFIKFVSFVNFIY